MMKSIVLFVILALLSSPAFAALSSSTVFQIQSTATSGNVNAGGFNPANANFMTDGAATSATGSAAVFTSATYSYAAGDVGAWIFISSGTNWNANCYYKIASVSGGAATVNSAAGAGVCVANNRYAATTSAGVASVASPTGATFGIDYSQQDTAAFADTDLASTTGTTAPCTVTSTSHPFGPNMLGNLLHITAGTSWTVAYYEVVSVSGTTATLDKACGSSATLSSGTGKVGGALSLGSADTNIFSSSVLIPSSTASPRLFVKGNATYTLSSGITMPNGNTLWPIIIEGYNLTRGDRPTDSTRPILAAGAGTFVVTVANVARSIQFTGTAASVVTLGVGAQIIGLKVTNSSTTAARNAVTTSSFCVVRANELISYRGNGLSLANTGCIAEQNYIHDSNIGIAVSTTTANIFDNILAGNVTAAISLSAAGGGDFIEHNTIYGAENKLGTGLNIFTGTYLLASRDNIFCGLSTGVTGADVQASLLSSSNDYFNNTTDITDTTRFQKGSNDLALDPTFAGVMTRTGSTATTTTGNHLVQTGATFQSWGVTPGRDYLYLVSGTGITVGVYGIASVDSETQITTDIALTADATADKRWQITTGRNWAIGTNLKALGSPGAFPGATTTGYTDGDVPFSVEIRLTAIA